MEEWQLTDTHIYKLLKHPRQVDTSLVEEMSSAYLDFVERLFDYLNKEKNNKEVIRKLNSIQVECATLQGLEQAAPTQHSKLKLIFIEKLLSLINMETELVYRQMEYPKFFINVETDWKSPFYLNPDIISATDVMEIVSGIFNIDENAVLRLDRRQVFFSEFAHIFEKALNISFGDVHKKEKSVIKRTANKITEFLDRLKASVINRSKKEGYR